MNKAKLKAYAPQARKDFIAAINARAHRLGWRNITDSSRVRRRRKAAIS
ncbi:MAG: hypothetical protein ACU84H_15375 [Gammaproteobacteria bacterium]